MSQSQTGSTAVSSGNRGTSEPPAMLIRTMTGHITLWSPAMEERYGFTASEALGHVAHQLLRTIFWKSLHEIEAALVAQKSWGGGLLHRRADGRLAMTAHHWHIHSDVAGHEPLVSELHSDIAVADARGANVLADIIGVLGHELSQPMTAVSNYITGANRLVQPASANRPNSGDALIAAAEQMARVKEGMALFRQLGDTLRPSSGVAVAPPTGQREEELASHGREA